MKFLIPKPSRGSLKSGIDCTPTTITTTGIITTTTTTTITATTTTIMLSNRWQIKHNNLCDHINILLIFVDTSR